MNLEETVKSLVYDVILKLVIGKIIEAVPFLAWPVINPLFVWALTHVAGLIYEELARHVNFIVIDIKTKEQVKTYEEATSVLKTAIETNGDVDGAKENFKGALRDLIRFGVVRQN